MISCVIASTSAGMSSARSRSGASTIGSVVASTPAPAGNRPAAASSPRSLRALDDHTRRDRRPRARALVRSSRRPPLATFEMRDRARTGQRRCAGRGSERVAAREPRPSTSRTIRARRARRAARAPPPTAPVPGSPCSKTTGRVGHQHAAHDRRSGVRQERILETAPLRPRARTSAETRPGMAANSAHPRAHRIRVERLRKKLDRHIGRNERAASISRRHAAGAPARREARDRAPRRSHARRAVGPVSPAPTTSEASAAQGRARDAHGDGPRARGRARCGASP